MYTRTSTFLWWMEMLDVVSHGEVRESRSLTHVVLIRIRTCLTCLDFFTFLQRCWNYKYLFEHNLHSCIYSIFWCPAPCFPEITLKNKGPSLLSVIELKCLNTFISFPQKQKGVVRLTPSQLGWRLPSVVKSMIWGSLAGLHGRNARVKKLRRGISIEDQSWPISFVAWWQDSYEESIASVDVFLQVV